MAGRRLVWPSQFAAPSCGRRLCVRPGLAAQKAKLGSLHSAGRHDRDHGVGADTGGAADVVDYFMNVVGLVRSGQATRRYLLGTRPFQLFGVGFGIIGGALGASATSWNDTKQVQEEEEYCREDKSQPPEQEPGHDV